MPELRTRPLVCHGGDPQSQTDSGRDCSDQLEKTMRWLLVLMFGCCLHSLVSAAPQEAPSNDANKDDTKHATSDESTVGQSIVDESVVSSETLSTEPNVETSIETKESTIDVPIEEIHSESAIGKKEETSGTESAPLVVEEAASQRQVPEAIIDQQTATVKPATAEVVTESTTKSPADLSTAPQTITTKKPRRTTVKPLATEAGPVSVAVATPTTASPVRRYPCRCAGGMCSCCTGLILENFNVPLRSRACANVTYEPDDFAFNFNLLYNNRVLYNTRMSAKNPRPACIPINRYFGIKMCAKLSNVYMSGRNIHACLDLEGLWDDETAFNYSFNCFRIGSNGIAVVRPEDGGGLPPPPDEEGQTDEDYDDSARGWTSDVQVVEN